MATWFIVIIYLSFISLGLPDSLLGTAWPLMRPDLGASLGTAGMISMTIAGGTIISSLFSSKVIRRLGTGKVTLVSCILTAGALLGYSFAPSMIWLILLAIPLGLGAGSVDSALNNYVAQNYQVHHMNWLHCFWGVGATTGPIIMSYYIANHNSWRGGYLTVSILQFVLVIILFVTLPLWNIVAAKHASSTAQDKDSQAKNTNQIETNNKNSVLGIKGVKNTLIAFLFYCGAESSVGLWGASYLVGARHITPDTAAGWVSVYYGGITVGRFITGFIAMKLPNKILIRTGQLTAIAGAILLFLPLPGACAAVALLFIGLGMAPIFPGFLHETPTRFGSENSSKLMGYQMAVAYTGATFLPPLFGLVASKLSISLLPPVVLGFMLLVWLNAEKVNQILWKKARIINSGNTNQ